MRVWWVAMSMAVAVGCVEIPDRQTADGAATPGDAAPLDGQPPTDLGGVDSVAPSDMAADLALPVDMALSVDMALPVDMAVPPDLALPPDDGAVPDAEAPDMGTVAPLAFEFRGEPVVDTAWIDALRAGQTIAVAIDVFNVGSSAVVIDDVTLDVRRGGELELAETPEIIDRGQASRIIIEWTARPGAVGATLTLHTDAGPATLDIEGLGWTLAHVAATPDGRVAHTPDVGASWSALAPTAVQGGEVTDIACGGGCTDDPRAPDALCVMTVSGGADGEARILISEDGSTWLPASFDGNAPSTLVAVDYGPPWMATDGAFIYQSPDGREWVASIALDADGIDPGPVTDLAVDRRGVVVLVTGSSTWWIYGPRIDGGSREGIVRQPLHRVVDGRDGTFMAVGEGGRYLSVEANGAGRDRADMPAQAFIDVAPSSTAEVGAWVATSAGAVWLLDDVDRGWGDTGQRVALGRFAVTDAGILGQSLEEDGTVVTRGLEGQAMRVAAPATFTHFAGGALCPTGRFEPGAGAVD